MKNHLSIALFLGLSSTALFAQKSWEVGVQAGIAAYQGEINPSFFAFQTFKNITPQGGVLARYNISPQFSFELNARYGSLSAKDADADTEEQQRRNLSFRTQLITAALQVDYNLFGYQPYNMDQPISPYIFAGAEYFHINPQAEYQGRWVDLQPLGTEGQGLSGRGSKYSLHNIAIPMGAGMRVALNEQWAVGLEFGVRKTFTDYIDDVGGTYMKKSDLAEGNGALAAELSNRTGEIGKFNDYRTGSSRGSRNDDDWYTFANISVSHLLYTNRPKGERGRGLKRFGCPKWLGGKGVKTKKVKPKGGGQSSGRRKY